MVEWGGLENRCAARYPGFESLSLRQQTIVIYCLIEKNFVFICSGPTFGPTPNLAQFTMSHAVVTQFLYRILIPAMLTRSSSFGQLIAMIICLQLGGGAIRIWNGK